MPSMLELVQSLAVWALPVLFAFTGHAMVMAHAAWRLGDRSEAMRERLSLNPLAHADPLGTLVVPGLLIALGGFVIGWPKPVPIEPRAFGHPRKALATVSLAALASNIVMALAWAVLLKAAVMSQATEGVWVGVKLMAYAGVTINLVFLLFGLLPIPGFAGGHVVGAILPPPLAARWYASQNLVFVALLVLMVTGVLGQLLGGPLMALQGLVFGLVQIA
jgi:Zn-dependent protease